MPPAIERMATTLLVNPVKIAITPESTTVEMIDQFLYYVDKENKKNILLHILKDKSIVSALVFTRTKHGADRVVRALAKENVIAQAIHGDKSQNARQLALNNFKNKTLRVLVATDIAARGIDIDELSHVINFDLPNVPETYVHRIGRTGRAGLGGVAISFCDFDEKELLVDIEKLIRKHIPVIEDHPYPLMNTTPSIKETQSRQKSSQNSRSNIESEPKRKTRMTSSGALKEKRGFRKNPERPEQGKRSDQGKRSEQGKRPDQSKRLDQGKYR